ncbi:MAG: site-specific DNA-methyltransferase, partial [Verrucomicrobiota bacterium]|nr:site-specific DNA-methyltransferase [Verrucomicrobiota bacterium]
MLKQELSDSIVDGPRERYRLDWPGKREALLTANAPIAKTLRPCRGESVDFYTTENLFIEGDNLDALKLLQETYLGKVKMIYIDPPYNTGKDFIYTDKFAKSAKDELLESGQIDEEGGRLVANMDSNGRFHSDWLSMMYSRLKLARNLLKDDGVIFISIDDSEYHNLKKIADEVFGEANNLGTIVWKKKTNGNNMGYIPPVHDYFLTYGKIASDDSLLGFPLSEEFISKTYSNPDNDPRGSWTTSDLSANHLGPYFEIKNSETGDIFLPPKGRYWVFGENEVKKRIEDERIIFGKSGTGRPIQKKFLNERASMRRKAESWWDRHGMNEDGTSEISKLIATKAFTHPKPSSTLKHLCNICTQESDIILDFFAGSATTAHAVMQLNSEDGGSRKFIMVQLPEECNEKSEAYKAGYANIAEISKERIRRAGKKISAECAEKSRNERNKDTLGLFEKQNNSQLDIGFRVLKVDSSNMSDVY